MNDRILGLSDIAGDRKAVIAEDKAARSGYIRQRKRGRPAYCDRGRCCVGRCQRTRQRDCASRRAVITRQQDGATVGAIARRRPVEGAGCTDGAAALRDATAGQDNVAARRRKFTRRNPEAGEVKCAVDSRQRDGAVRRLDVTRQQKASHIAEGEGCRRGCDAGRDIEGANRGDVVVVIESNRRARGRSCGGAARRAGGALAGNGAR